MDYDLLAVPHTKVLLAKSSPSLLAVHRKPVLHQHNSNQRIWGLIEKLSDVLQSDQQARLRLSSDGLQASLQKISLVHLLLLLGKATKQRASPEVA